ncbi:MAG: Septum formation protein Maf [uncultured Thiotrichaceae bacterium]|uniref:dTTP/UTP pyrophosphatase n=1 Tax=uncultured Thiotrichaceae bacterium TaxID=298394 RepID=A0A6S6SCW4_9GAMM|nr:MAG: Septum formation protein Maf [uncultured Thiotrichaceae bacterium]
MTEIILASASPRRRELLDQIGIRYDVKVADVDESSVAGESADEMVVRLAALKAETIWQASDKTRPVLGSDTLGELQGQLLVKPVDFAHAHEMLSAMSGAWHRILSAVAVRNEHGMNTALSESKVWFRHLSDEEIKQYWNSGEPQDKAGSYAIQGLGAVFVERIEGSYSGIMGLPLFETGQLLRKVSVSVT